MSNNYYMYRQLSYAKIIREKGFQSNHLQYELRLLALYMRDVEDLKPKQRKEELHAFCKKWSPSYSYRGWYEVVNKALRYSQSKKRVLIECPCVVMYKSEIEYIDGLDVDENCKRTMLAIFVQKKLDKVSFESQHGGEYQIFAYGNRQRRINSLKRIAGLKGVKDMGLDVFCELVKAGLVEMIACKGDPIKLNFADKIAFEGEEAVRVTDYEKLGDYWSWLHGDKKVRLCAVCNAPFHVTSNRTLYCEDHRGYQKKQEAKQKEVVCAVCGEVFLVDARNNVKTKCDECQRKGRKH